jgi:deoxyribonuclease V
MTGIAMIDAAEESFFSKISALLASRSQNRSSSSSSVPNLICGCDAAYLEDNKRVLAAAVLLSRGKVIETSSYLGHYTFPYVPGLFYLHEGPFVVAAVRKLRTKPELVCFDAHGRSHPQRAGLATICGLVLDLQSIGVAKSPLFGKESPYKNRIAKVSHNGETLGFVTSKELGEARRFWSPGFSMSASHLERIVEKRSEECLRGLREAHNLAGELKKCR